MVFVWFVSFFSCARSYFKTFVKWHVSSLYIPFEHPYCSIYSIVISLCTCKAYIIYSFVNNLTDPKCLAIEVNVFIDRIIVGYILWDMIHVNYIAILDPTWGLNLLSRCQEPYKFGKEFYECHNHAFSFFTTFVAIQKNIFENMTFFGHANDTPYLEGSWISQFRFLSFKISFKQQW